MVDWDCVNGMAEDSSADYPSDSPDRGAMQRGRIGGNYAKKQLTPVFVIAGNYGQYGQFLDNVASIEYSRYVFRFVVSADTMRGCEGAIYTLYGTGNERKDLDEILTMARAGKFTFVASGVFTEEDD